MNIEIGPEALTDDRPPTLYFKIKTHKPTIYHSRDEPIQEVYTYSNVAKDLTKIARPIINHKNTIFPLHPIARKQQIHLCYGYEIVPVTV